MTTSLHIELEEKDKQLGGSRTAGSREMRLERDRRLDRTIVWAYMIRSLLIASEGVMQDNGLEAAVRSVPLTLI